MNSLGFIEREIESCKHEIQINKIRIENQFDKTFYENRAEVINEKLQTLQQIKSELEAWEAVKEYLVVEESRVDEDSYVDCIVLKDDCIHPLHSDLEGIHVSIIKEALEVEDE